MGQGNIVVRGSLILTLVSAILLVVVVAGRPAASEDRAEGTRARLFEMRTYTTPPGKLKALHTLFRNHTNKIFKKHGMTLVGFWTPGDAKLSQNTLIYILAYPDMKAREKAWTAFRNDPAWKKAAAESRVDGPLVKEVKSVFMTPTDFSPLK